MMFYIGLAIIQSCVCGDSYNTRLASISGDAKRIKGTRSIGAGLEYFIVEPYAPRTNGIRYDSIGIDIVNDLEKIAFNMKGNFFNTAFACEPGVTYEPLEGITITSSEDYTHDYAAGTDLSEIMSVGYGYEAPGIPINTYLSNAMLTHWNQFFTFNIPPSANKVHNLTIKYKLFDGREYEVFIEGLRINN